MVNVSLSIPAIEKLIDYSAIGIGSAVGHIFAGRIARREVEKRLIAAQGQAQANKILAEDHATTMQIIAKAQADARKIVISHDATVQGEVTFGELMSQRIQFQEEKRLSNSATVIGQAADELGDKEVQDHEIDHDWTARFFNDIQDVSTSETQMLYARILAGEVERPGSTSIKALSILRDLDQSTAVLFGTLRSTCISLSLDGQTILDVRALSLGGDASQNALREFGLSFDNLNILNEHGLIIPDYRSRHDIRMCISSPGTTDQGKSVLVRVPFLFQNRYWILEPTKGRKAGAEYQVSGVALTKAGRELSRVVECQPIPSYSEQLETFFKSQGFAMTEVNSGDLQILEKDAT